MCLDATEELMPLRLGRLVNHASENPNARTEQVLIDETPHIILRAERHIEVGEEIFWDYGERRRSIINAGNQFLLPATSDGAGKKI